jgi:hypothetical protein
VNITHVGQAPVHAVVTVAGATTIRVEAWRDNPGGLNTWTTSNIRNAGSAQGSSLVSYVKIG